jgi:putative membrane protein
MTKNDFTQHLWLGCIAALTAGGVFVACASDQQHTATAEEVRDGEALPPAPPVPAQPASTDSPTAPTVPGGSSGAAAPAADAPAAAPASPAKEALSEAQIAKITELANTAEVEQGKLAQTKAKAPNIKKFADMMVKHHGDAKQEQAKLFKKLNLTPADSATAGALKADADKTLDSLKKSDAAGFDAAYVASQIDAHQKVLDAIDAQLLPAATTPELAENLRKMRKTVEQHLSEAKGLQQAK